MSCTVFSEKTVKTKKPHWCFACLRDFPAGSMLVRQTNVLDGEIGSVYTCETCKKLLKLAAHELVDAYEDGFNEGCVSEMIEYKELATPEEWLSEIENK